MNNNKTDAKELLDELKSFSGTEHYYRSSFGRLRLTDGMHFLRERASCYWLVDVVESVQHLAKIQEYAGFIVWQIRVSGNKAVVSAWNDTPGESEKLYVQEIEYTDFPLKEFEFYQVGDVLLLKGEY
ncbi:MAG: hypothetical protein V1809_08810 [Planctomycetota bacterium]